MYLPCLIGLKYSNNVICKETEYKRNYCLFTRKLHRAPLSIITNITMQHVLQRLTSEL